MTTLLSCKNLSRVFADGVRQHHALRDFSADFSTGQLVAITGPSGAGKSTLFHILGTLDVGYEGSAQLHGQELKALTDAERAALRRSTVSLAFQAPHLFTHLSVRENLTLSERISGKDTEYDGQAHELIERFQLQGLLDVPPATLSGGEKRRISMIRTLLKPAEVFLLDEPSAHLDEALQKELFLVLKERAAQGSLIIFSSHALQDLRNADQHFALKAEAS